MQRTINVSFASSKFPLQSRQIAIPQDAESLPSKYTPAVQNELTDLDTTIKQLDFDAKERSRIFQARLDEIWSDVHNFEAQLKSEIVASAESIDAIRLDYQSHIDNFQENFLKEINQIFDRYDQELIPPMHQHLDSINKDIDQFFHQKAPLSIQQQAGEVNRHLRRMFEMFNIEQQRQIKRLIVHFLLSIYLIITLLYRDLKLVKRVNKYFQSTEQRLEDERALQASCCYNLEDIISELQRPAARLFLMRVNQSIHSIVSLRDTHKLEVQKRLSEDLDVLDTIVETQELLKQIILLHFSKFHSYLLA